jgi:regulator of sigma E protease
LYSLLGFFITVGILVTLHELGHYCVARWCGVKVLRFSFGFGSVLFSRRFGHDQTEWALSAVPLGGYVRMLDERDRQEGEGPVPESELPRAFNRQSVWKRMAVVAAGPLSNLLLAVLLLAAMYMAGVPGYQPVLSQPVAGTVAAEAGLRSMDRILTVDGEPVAVWQDVNQKLLNADITSSALLTVERDGYPVKASLSLAAMMADDDGKDSKNSEDNPLARLGLHPYLGAPLIAKVSPDSPAAAAGLQKSDIIQAVNGVTLDTPSAMASLINQNANQAVDQLPSPPVELTILRDGMTMPLSVTPRWEEVENGKKVARIGVVLSNDPKASERYRVMMRYGVVESLGLGVTKTWDLTVLIFKTIGRMITGSASLKNLSGPITIAEYAGQSIQMGFQPFFTFLALVSIVVGIFNLLPVPVLDGGHLLYYFAEIIRGRPLPERVMEIGLRIGLTLVITLIVLALFNDFSRKF